MLKVKTHVSFTKVFEHSYEKQSFLFIENCQDIPVERQGIFQKFFPAAA